jgi:hypothetical protein
MTMGVDQIAVLVRNTLAAEDLSAFAKVLDPAVTWERPPLAIPAVRTVTRLWPGISGVEMVASGRASMK